MGVKDCRQAGSGRRTFFLRNFLRVWKGGLRVKQKYWKILLEKLINTM